MLLDVPVGAVGLYSSERVALINWLRRGATGEHTMFDAVHDEQEVAWLAVSQLVRRDLASNDVDGGEPFQGIHGFGGGQ